MVLKTKSPVLGVPHLFPSFLASQEVAGDQRGDHEVRQGVDHDTEVNVDTGLVLHSHHLHDVFTWADGILGVFNIGPGILEVIIQDLY